MKIQASRLCVQTSVWVLASAFCVASLAGCGANGNFTSSVGSDTPVAGISGVVHGGPNPVVGATVTLYATTTENSPASGNNYGYGEAGTVLGTATTGTGGDFSFTGSGETACPAGQQAYIVAAGGNTGAGPTNPAALLMAALGPCSGITEGSGAGATTVIINEPTTIAAAYALSGFMTVSGTTVNISAPANNNASAASCTVVSNATTACAASGLAHAFLNAANLVNSTTGVVNTTIPTGSTIKATVPQALINTLANTVEACVNSTGATTPSTMPCAVLFTNTKPTQLTSPTAPANTLQALLDLAQYPSAAADATTDCTGSNASTCVQPSAATTALFTAANSNAYYSPALTSAPLDFTIGINYTFAPSGSAVAPWGVATDIKDNVYVYAASTPATIYSLTSNGAQNWSTPSVINTGLSSSNQKDGCATAGTRCEPLTDTIGNLWVLDQSGITQFNTASGAIGTQFITVDLLSDGTVDLGNNVWASAYGTSGGAGTQSTPSDLEELPQGSTSTTAIVDVQVGGAVVTGSTPMRDIAFDNAGNLWAASDSAAGAGPGALLMISENNSLTAPNFDYTAASNPGLYLGGTGANIKSMTPMLDAIGNLWLPGEDELNQFPCSSPCTETGGATNYTATTGTLIYGGPSGSGAWDQTDGRYASMDGDGKIILDGASGSTGFLSVYYPNAPSDGNGGASEGGANTYLNPCYVAPSTTVCDLTSNGTSLIVNAGRTPVIDDSGAIWSSFSSGDTFLQLFGPAAPSWGQRSWIPKAMQTNTSLRPY
jgi:hypothetical protein